MDMIATRSIYQKAAETRKSLNCRSKTKMMLVASLAMVGIISINIAFSQLTSYVLIKSVGSISAHQIIAKSGSPKDIQDAVDAIAAAGGGIVYVPEGIFQFNPPSMQWGCAVKVPGGVSVIGAGKGKTILRQTVVTQGLTTYFFGVDGSNGKPARISGFTLEVTGLDKEEPEGAQTVGIDIENTKDFRIDHVEFFNFTGFAIYVEHSRGVIDQCYIDNPYKDDVSVPPEGRIWAYGVGVVGTYYNWEPDISKLLGHYNDLDTVVYIEDCTFRRCRHAISANGGAHYVARHNYFTEMILSYYGSYIDAHGASGAPPAVGTRCFEIYDNIIEDSPTDKRSTDDERYWGQYLGMGVGIRGGGGVIFNNVIKYCRTGIKLYSDAVWEQCKPHDIWIWNNAFTDVQNPLWVAQPPDSSHPITENVDYFLYAPAWYNPYPYPHPLTLTP